MERAERLLLAAVAGPTFAASRHADDVERRARPRAAGRTGGAVQEGMRDTVPLWLASAITVVVSLPFGLWLGNYSLPLWVAFIVWAEYFTLGATPSVLRIIVPAYLLGVSGATLLLVAYTLTARAAGDAQLFVANDLAMIVAFFVCFCALVYAMRFARVTQVGTLPFFNGISMLLGVYFTHSYVAAAGLAYDAE